MSAAPGIVDRLRAAFAADDRGPVSGEACPESAELWEAQHESIAVERARRIVQHVARCPSCAAEWRMAMAAGAPGGAVALSADRTARATPERRRLAAGAVGVAAALVIGVGALVLVPGLRPEPLPAGFRGAEAAIGSLVPEDQALDREACILRWSPVGPGARYAVHVARPALEPLAEAHGLEQPEYTVPQSVLAGLASGEKVVWRVEATLLDGGHLSSPAFVHRLE